MKKIILSSLFSSVLVFGAGSISAFADDLGPTEPTTPSEPEKPVTPEQPKEPTKPIEVVVTPSG